MNVKIHYVVLVVNQIIYVIRVLTDTIQNIVNAINVWFKIVKSVID